VPLVLAPAHAPVDLADMPFEFSMSMGVRKNDTARARLLESVLARRRPEIDGILKDYGVPRAAPGGNVGAVTQ
jgi:mxaJ protein